MAILETFFVINLVSIAWALLGLEAIDRLCVRRKDSDRLRVVIEQEQQEPVSYYDDMVPH